MVKVKIHTKSVVRVYSPLTHIHTSESTSESENFLLCLKTAIAIVKAISPKKGFFNVYFALTEDSVNGPYR